MILLDTHVIIWHWHGDKRMGPSTRRTVESALNSGDAVVSAVSFWEVGMRIQKGQLHLDLPLDAWRQEMLRTGLLEIPVDGSIAARAVLLPDMHGDPADRFIVATALGGHQLVTADQRILQWPESLARVDARV